MNAAIVCLTRGYSNPNYYQNLINRNRHIYENFNRLLEKQYPLLIFHEGNISSEHQNFILAHEKNEKVFFVDIGSDFMWPQNIDQSQVLDNRFTLGYRLMCRFHTAKIWKYVYEYDYIMRIDEDVMIGPLQYDIFDYMQKNNLDYMPSRFMHEYHDLTNDTLPKRVQEFLPQGLWQEENYDQTTLWIPYTNLYAARVSIFTSPQAIDFLQKITDHPDFLIHRWGDAPLHGICLKLFSSFERISIIHNFICLHGTHDCITENGRPISGIMSEYEAKYFDCVPSGKGEMHYIARGNIDGTLYRK